MEKKERHLTYKSHQARRTSDRTGRHYPRHWPRVHLLQARRCDTHWGDEVHKGSSGLIRRELEEPDLTLNQDPHRERAAFIRV